MFNIGALGQGHISLFRVADEWRTTLEAGGDRFVVKFAEQSDNGCEEESGALHLGQGWRKGHLGADCVPREAGCKDDLFGAVQRELREAPGSRTGPVLFALR